MKPILVLIFSILVFSGCATISEYFESATHGCTHEKDGKVKGPFPMKLVPGQPVSWEEDGWKITCEPYPE